MFYLLIFCETRMVVASVCSHSAALEPSETEPSFCKESWGLTLAIILLLPGAIMALFSSKLFRKKNKINTIMFM